MNRYLGILEGLLFVVGDEGLTLQQIEELLEINEDDFIRVKKFFLNYKLIGIVLYLAND